MSGRIYQRGKDPKKWTIVVELGRDPATGRRRRASHAFRGSKAQANAELARLTTHIADGTYIEDAKLTMAEFLTGWLTGHAETKVAPKTFRSYRLYIERDITPRIGNLRLKRLTPPAVKALIESMREDGLSARTVQYAHATLRAALSYAVEMGWIKTNPAAPISPPRPEPRPMSTLDAATSVELLRRLEGHPVWLPTLLAIYTGMRRGEILGLAWPHVDLEGGTIYVTRALTAVKDGVPTYTAANPRKNHSRALAVGETLVAALRQHLQRQSQLKLDFGEQYVDHDLVVCRPDGRPWEPDNLTKTFHAAVTAIGVTGLRFHDLRHTHATMLIAGGTHAKIASARLGHSQIGITMNLYGHVAPGLDRGAAEAFERMLEDSSPTAGQQFGSTKDKKAPRR